MVSVLKNSSGASQAVAPDLQLPGSAAVSSPQKVTNAPKVSAPKPVDIKFDPAQARQNLKSAISMLNEQMASTKQGLGFSFDESINSAVIKVSNIHTGEVVRQIPSEEVLRMAHKIDDLKGILYNKVV
ncbi:MAG: flagellar protein FlaG [Cryomorphaceae bacterium]|nr:flagellar protein FlaG [Cryomorphaceae bacterium]